MAATPRRQRHAVQKSIGRRMWRYPTWKSSLLEVAKAAGTIDVGDHDTLVNRTHDQRVHIASTENEGREPLDVTANGEEMNSVGILNDGNRAIRLSPEPFRQVAVVELNHSSAPGNAPRSDHRNKNSDKF